MCVQIHTHTHMLNTYFNANRFLTPCEGNRFIFVFNETQIPWLLNLKFPTIRKYKYQYSVNFLK